MSQRSRAQTSAFPCARPPQNLPGSWGIGFLEQEKFPKGGQAQRELVEGGP